LSRVAIVRYFAEIATTRARAAVVEQAAAVRAAAADSLSALVSGAR